MKTLKTTINIKLGFNTNININKLSITKKLSIYYSWLLLPCLQLINGVTNTNYCVYLLRYKRWAILRSPKCHKIGQKHFGLRKQKFIIMANLEIEENNFWKVWSQVSLLLTLLLLFSTNLLQLHFIKLEIKICYKFE